MPLVMDWPRDDASAALGRALNHLRESQLVLLPTESGYVVAAGALVPGAIAALAGIAGPDNKLHVLLGQAAHVFDWLPFFRGAGLRLVRRYWPGPLILISGDGARQGLLPRFPPAVRGALAPHGQLALRLCEDAVVQALAQHLEMPLVAATLSFGSGAEAAQALGEAVALVIHHGKTAHAKPATVVRVHGRSWQVMREGAIPAAEINDAAPCRIVFLCTGNTCRSPMAEALCRKVLAGSLKCDAAELPGRGFCVQSAGLAAMMGMAATPEAAQAAAEYGGDLSRHASQPISAEVLYHADHLFAMTESHLRMLDGVPGIAPQLLSRAGQDVADPIGGSAEVYRHCAGLIHGFLEERLPELLEC
jgi:L-threonylcarbamoyladenylate synthase